MISCSVDNQLQGAAGSNFMEHLFQVLPVTMVTQKPFRLAPRTWPVSTPSGVGMCHHRNSSPPLTKSCLIGPGQGWRGWGLQPGSRTHLGQAGSKEHTLEELPHPLEELVHVGPLQHVHLQRHEAASGSGTAVTGGGQGPKLQCRRVS